MGRHKYLFKLNYIHILQRIRIQQNKLTQSFLRLQKVTDLKNINVNVLL